MLRFRSTVALLCLAGGAAQAQETLGVYGVLDLGLKYDGGAARHGAWSVASGNRQGSRIGVRGAEALGRGLRTTFVLESGVNADDGTLGNGGRLWGRQAWIGLEGDLGALTVGRQYSGLYLSLKAIDPFRIQEAGDMQRSFAYGVARLDPLSRVDDSVVFTSARYAAWQGRVGHRFVAAPPGSMAGASSFADIAYDASSLLVHATWQEAHDLALGTTAAQQGGLLQVAGLGPRATRVRSLFLGAVLKLDTIKLHGGYGDTRVEAGKPLGISNLMLGLSLAAGNGTWIASVNQVALGHVEGGAARQAAMGYAYRTSKHTELYASASHTVNQHRVALNASVPGGSARELRTGLVHTF